MTVRESIRLGRPGATDAEVEQAARDSGCADVRWYEKKEEAYGELVEAYAPGSALLLKASHFSGRFDQTADYLREYPFGEEER